MASSRHFDGLTAGYGNDLVGLAILHRVRFLVDITGDERDTPASAQEGKRDRLALLARLDPTSTIIKFEQRLVLSAESPVEIPSAAAGAEYLSEAVGEEVTNWLFLPLINR